MPPSRSGSRPRRRHTRTALALGGVAVFAGVLVWQVPGVADVLARVPVLRLMTWARAGFLLPLALAGLAALGLDAWLRRASPARLAGAAIVVQLAVLLLVATAPAAARQHAWATVWLPVAVALIALAGRGRAGWWLAGAVVLESVVVGWQLVPACAEPGLATTGAIARAAGQAVAAEPGRIVAAADALPANLGASLGFADLRSHDPVRPLALARVHRALGATGMDLAGPVTTPWAGLAGAWGVRWLVTPADGLRGPVAAGWQEVYAGADGRIWRNARALDEVRLAGAAVESPGDPATGSWEPIDFATTAVVAGPITASGGGRLEVVERRPAQTTATVAARGTVLAILHAPHAPGWTATVDGRPAPLIEANLGAMAVLVPDGVHEVRWRYRPPGLWAGIVLTIAGLLACGMLARGGRTRPANR
jgi:hypothetical protein